MKSFSTNGGTVTTLKSLRQYRDLEQTNFEESKAIQGPGTDMAVGENDYISSKDCT